MYFRCYNNCPEFLDEPCELSVAEMNKYIGRSTPCPIGEGDGFYECEEGTEFFCMIIGSRTFLDYEFLTEKTDHLLSDVAKNMHITIVSGGADGADKLAERYARDKGYRFLVFNADWNRGKKAGYERNERMHKFLSTVTKKYGGKRGVIAFWDGKSKGTAQSFELAKKYNNPIRVIRV